MDNNNNEWRIDLPLDVSDRPLVLERISKVTHGFVPSDLQLLCTQVILELVRQKEASTANFEQFQRALEHVKPSTLSEYRVPHVKFSEIFGLEPIIHELKVRARQIAYFTFVLKVTFIRHL